MEARLVLSGECNVDNALVIISDANMFDDNILITSYFSNA